MGGANLHTPQSVFQHMMGQQNSPQQSGGPWLQMPQVPALSMPWSIPALQQPDLIRFTGERSQPAYGVTSLHHKRKLSTPDVTDIRKVKQFITEEKMASHFQGLRISSNYHDQQNSTPSTSTACSDRSVSDDSQYIDCSMESTDTVDQNSSREPRLIISEELKRMQEEPLIPVTLLSKLERPSMALVLWEPPSKHLARVLPTPHRDTPSPFSNLFEDNNNGGNNNNNSSGSSSSNNSNNNRSSGIGNGINTNQNNNNNNNSIIDLNQSSLGQLEPMEL